MADSDANQSPKVAECTLQPRPAIISPSASTCSSSSSCASSAHRNTSIRCGRLSQPPPLPPPNGSAHPPPLPPPNPPVAPARSHHLHHDSDYRPAILAPSASSIKSIGSPSIATSYTEPRSNCLHQIRLPTARPRVSSSRWRKMVRHVQQMCQAIAELLFDFVQEIRTDLRDTDFAGRLSLLALQYSEALIHLYCLLISLRLVREHRSIDSTCRALSCRNRYALVMCSAIVLDVLAIIAVLRKQPLASVAATFCGALFISMAWLMLGAPLVSVWQSLMSIATLTLAVWLSLRWIVDQHAELGCTDSNRSGVCKHCAHHLHSSSQLSATRSPPNENCTNQA